MTAYDDLPLRGGAPAHRPSPSEAAHLVGSMSRIDDRAVLRGVRSVRQGVLFSLNARVEEISPPFFGRPSLEHVVSEVGPRWLDEVVDNFNPQASSQWDGLGHVTGVDGLFFTEVDASAIKERRRDSVGALAARGVATRGVLLDLRDYVVGHGGYDKRVPVPVDVVEEAIVDTGVSLETGDILVIHTGYLEWYRTLDQVQRVALSKASPAYPGIDQGRRMARLLWDSGLAGVASDTPGLEAAPSLDPDASLHHHMVGNLGFWFGEFWDTGALAQHLRASDQADFLLTSAPMRLDGAIGSPANALAVV